MQLNRKLHLALVGTRGMSRLYLDVVRRCPHYLCGSVTKSIISAEVPRLQVLFAVDNDIERCGNSTMT